VIWSWLRSLFVEESEKANGRSADGLSAEVSVSMEPEPSGADAQSVSVGGPFESIRDVADIQSLMDEIERSRRQDDDLYSQSSKTTTDIDIATSSTRNIVTSRLATCLVSNGNKAFLFALRQSMALPGLARVADQLSDRAERSDSAFDAYMAASDSWSAKYDQVWAIWHWFDTVSDDIGNIALDNEVDGLLWTSACVLPPGNWVLELTHWPDHDRENPTCASRSSLERVLWICWGVDELEEKLTRVRHVGPETLVAGTDLTTAAAIKECLEKTGARLRIYETPNHGSDIKHPRRLTISAETRREVWRRDQGQCVDCGSRNLLEFDHIVPHSKGGANTVRNIELRCQACNRRKSDDI